MRASPMGDIPAERGLTMSSASLAQICKPLNVGFYHRRGSTLTVEAETWRGGGSHSLPSLPLAMPRTPDAM
jgi:hypothetical protein